MRRSTSPQCYAATKSRNKFSAKFREYPRAVHASIVARKRTRCTVAIVRRVRWTRKSAVNTPAHATHARVSMRRNARSPSVRRVMYTVRRTELARGDVSPAHVTPARDARSRFTSRGSRVVRRTELARHNAPRARVARARRCTFTLGSSRSVHRS